MKKLIISLLVIALSGQLFACAAPQGEPLPENEPAAVDWSVVSDAYTFALPLLLMDASQTVATNTEEATEDRAPLNQLRHSTHLVDASFTDVVTPNVDTIYTQASLDLRDDAIVFHKPAADRFLSVEIMDFYTNSVAILGTGGDTQEACTYVFTGPEWQDELPDGLVHVPIPTNNAGVIVRTLVQDEADMVNVVALQAQMQMVPLSNYLTKEFDYEAPQGVYNEEDDIIPVEYVLSLSCEEFFTRANELMIANPPSSADAAMLARLASINVGPGLTFAIEALGEDASEQWAEMVATHHDKLLEQSMAFVNISGAWQSFGEPIAEFGTEYAYRALVALDGLGANPVSVAIYPKASTDDTGELLHGINNYVIHFEADQLPPVEQYGFWSITAYGENNFLIDNELNRYSVNDRSDVTFNEDGSLDILVQAEAPADAAMLGNWLPVTTEQFHVYMRIYLPAKSALDGTWVTPSIEVQD